MRYAPFFFFFEFRPDWAVSADTGRYGRYRPIRSIRTESARFRSRRSRFRPRRCRFQPRRPDSGIATWHDAARTRGLRRPSRVAASRRDGRECAGLGAVSVHPKFKEKTLRSHHLFSFLLTQPNTLQKVFIPIFFPKFFIYPISPPNKHIKVYSP